MFSGAPAGDQTGSVHGTGQMNFPEGSFSNTPFIVGGRVLDGAVWYDATQGELILLDGVLSVSERDKLERYLMEKWDL